MLLGERTSSLSHSYVKESRVSFVEGGFALTFLLFSLSPSLGNERVSTGP
jgi:hypothetical protein